MKNKTHTEKMRENPWILATLVLGILVLILIVGAYLKADREISNLTSPKALCSKATGTPAWFDWRGDLIDSGYMPMALEGRNDSEGIVDNLIYNKVYFVYSSTCGWCHKQIEWFGEEQWKKYQESGFTADCNKNENYINTFVF